MIELYRRKQQEIQDAINNSDASGIATNASGIATNASGIATNASDITTINNYLNAFNFRTLSANGYTRLPNNILIQWGSVTSSTDNDQTITYPVSFNGSAYSITTNYAGSVSRASSNFVHNRINEIDGTPTLRWIAIGRW
jgi:hypothetical protein